MTWLLYGANGYTGELVARRAAASGERPVLAGRSAGPVEALARELGLDHRVASLDDAAGLDRALGGMAAVLHCAGPFSRTSRPMAEACLRARAHYLDITGEIAVFERLAARDGEARAAGVALLPGAGFDVVPTDCLAAHLKRRLPSATRLALGFQGSSATSRGTATTALEGIHLGGAVRRDGRIVRVPLAWGVRTIDFGAGPRTAMTIPWGDVSTAYHSTGIPDVEVYMAAPPKLVRTLRLARPLLPLFALRPLQALLRRRIRQGPPGPTAEQRARGRSLVWGEATDGAARVAATLETLEGYELTSRTALEAVRRAAAGRVPPGFQTPSRAFGPDFILEFPPTTRRDA